MPCGIPVVFDVETPPWAKPRDCIANVERAIADYGCSVEYGWQFWETLPGVMLEAEFHAFWIDQRGGRQDNSPKDFGFEQSVFLADPSLVYEGRQVSNVRVPLQDDQLIRDSIAVAETHDEATNRGELATKHGDIAPFLTPEEKEEIAGLVARRDEIGLKIAQKYYLR